MAEPSDQILNNLGIARFGHSSVVHDNKVYIFGGFSMAFMLNTLLIYHPSNCSEQTKSGQSQCCKKVFSLNCIWNDQEQQCQEYSEDMTLGNRINTAALPNANSKKNSNTDNLSASADGDANTLCHPNFIVDRLANGNFSQDYSRSKCPIKFSNNNESCKKVTSCRNCENSLQCVSLSAIS